VEDKNLLIVRTRPNVENIPEEMRSLNQWVCWKVEKNSDGKLVKVLYDPKTKAHAKVNDPKTWASFNKAIKAFDEDPFYDGNGFVVSVEDPYCGLDVDHSRNPDTRELREDAKEIVDRLNSYTEVSPSGTGIRVWVKGKLPEKGRKRGDYEAYDSGHYFTFTGNVLNGKSSVEDRQEELSWYHQKYISNGPRSLDDKLISEIKRGVHGEKMKLLWSSDITGYPSSSEADLALCSFLAKVIGNRPDRIDSLFRRSDLFREKWDKVHHGDGKTYGRGTIDKAVEELPLCFESAIIDADQFLSVEIPPRKEILPWLLEQMIVLISGWRGTGKTWFGLTLFDAISRGKPFAPWPVINSVSSLYVDGEMAASELQERLRLLSKGKGPRKNPMIIYNDAYANSLGVPRANLLNEKWRDDLKSFLIENQVKVLGLDNISSLAPGIDENSKKDWDPINRWLIELRFSGIASMLFHNEGKGGNQRGTSGREDNIDVSLALIQPPDYFIEQGARFIAQFKKMRIHVKDPSMISDHEFQLTMVKDHVEWATVISKTQSKLQVLRLLSRGLKQADIVKSLCITKGRVSQIRTQAIEKGLLTEKNELTKEGENLVERRADDEEF